MLDTWVTGFHQMQAFKIIQTCYLECVLRNVINFSWNQHRPTISGDFFCLAAGQHRHRNDALWRRSVCSVSFCLAWVQDLLVMALEFFKHISSSQLWLWQGSVVKTHVHLTSVTTCYYPSWFSPKSGGRGQAQTARPRPFRPVWGLLPVPSSSSILLKIISLARWARMRV